MMYDGCTDLCVYAKVNEALEIHCTVSRQFVYHIDRSVTLSRPYCCIERKNRIACDQTKKGNV
jgi:hypothetical protein